MWRVLPIAMVLLACERPPAFEPPVLELVGGLPESESLRLQGVLPFRVHGQAVGARASYVGMGRDLVRIDGSSGSIESLLVTSGGVATALATSMGPQGERVLVGTPIDARVALWDARGVEAPFPVGGAVAGIFLGDEPVLVYADGAGSCRIRFLDSDVDHPFRLSCPQQVGLATVDDHVLVALGANGLWRASLAGVERLFDVVERADGVGYDDVLEQVVIWQVPEERVIAVTPDYAPLWQRRVVVRALAVLPGQGMVWAELFGFGARLVLADTDGEPVESFELDRPVIDLVAAPDGSRLGVRREADHASYTVLP